MYKQIGHCEVTNIEIWNEFFRSIQIFLCNAGSYDPITLSLEQDDAAIDTVGTSMFTAVYRYEIQTQDARGNAVTDSILLALQVGTSLNVYILF